LRGSSPEYCCSSPNNLYNCVLLSRDEIAGHFFTPSENVRLLFAVGDSTAYFFYYEGGGNRVRSCLHAVENIVDDNYNNNRDIFIAELRCTTSACVLTAVSLWTDGRIACWHENEINKFPLTGRRENFLSVQMVSAWIVGRPDQREIEPRRLARVRVRPDVPNFKRPRDTIARFIVRV